MHTQTPRGLPRCKPKITRTVEWLFADQNLIRRWVDEYYPNAWTKNNKKEPIPMKTLTKTTKTLKLPMRMRFFSKHGSHLLLPKTGDAAAQVTSKCCKLQQLHDGLSLWWSLDGSLRSFCHKQSGDAAADIGATLSCAAGGYGEPWCFAKPLIKGTTNGEGFGTLVDPSFFVRAIFKFGRGILAGEGVVSIL